MNVYKVAWKKLRAAVESGKTSWGKVELAQLMSDCLEEAVEESTDDE